MTRWQEMHPTGPLYEPLPVVPRWGWHQHIEAEEAAGKQCLWCWLALAQARCDILNLLYRKIEKAHVPRER